MSHATYQMKVYFPYFRSELSSYLSASRTVLFAFEIIYNIYCRVNNSHVAMVAREYYRYQEDPSIYILYSQ